MGKSWKRSLRLHGVALLALLCGAPRCCAWGPLGEGGGSRKGATSAENAAARSDSPAPYEAASRFFDKRSLPALPKVLSVTLPSYVKAVLLYKPPVGATAVYVTMKLLFSRSSKFNKSFFSPLDDGGGMTDRGKLSTRKKRRRKGRSLDIDTADRHYDDFGGVEAVRAELYSAALADAAAPHTRDAPADAYTDINDDATLAHYAAVARDALDIHCAPRSSREVYVERTSQPLSHLQGLYDMQRSGALTLQSKRSTWSRTSTLDSVRLLWEAANLVEIRTLDALLRILRDRLLTSASRLARAERHWSWRVRWYTGVFATIVQRSRKLFNRSSLEDDRRNLQLATAALKREMERLGQVQQMLLVRPQEMSGTALLSARTASMNQSNTTEGTTASSSNPRVSNPFVPTDGNTSGTLVPTTKIQYGKIGSAGAKAVLSGSTKYTNGMDKEWIDAATEWNKNSRVLVCDLLTEALEEFEPTSTASSDRETNVEYDLQTLSRWSNYEKGDMESWSTALSLVDGLSKAREMRERKYLPITYLIGRIRQLDFFGVPSALATVGFALLVHNQIRPYWPKIVDTASSVGAAVWGIIEFRFWQPLRDIVLDLLNRRPRLLDPFALENEETSLDNMLYDLGIGDGTSNNRREALAASSRMYEEELAGGAIRNLLRGKMVRLLLIQIQQLKAGLLKAMGSIDDLVDSNRLNVQLLAAIPAFLLISVGTRVFFTALFSFRSQNFSGIKSVHSEMSEILRNIERCLLLASHEKDSLAMSDGKVDSSDKEAGLSSSNIVLQPPELGEFVLNAHSYLILLDYCSPPFPSKSCDSIHKSVQDLLMQGQLTTRRQIDLLKLINAKHAELL